MFEQLQEIVGSQPGPVSVVLAGVHGNERCGVDAFQALLPGLVITHGRVLFAYGNPRAIQVGTRFIDVNLNRLFRDSSLLSAEERGSYEYECATRLKLVFDQADALLDIHASTVPESTPFLICEPHAQSISSLLPMPYVVSGVDEVEPGGTDYYMNHRGGIGMTAECGSVADPASQVRAQECLIAFLKARGHLFNDLAPQKNQSLIQVYTCYLTQTDQFTLSRPYRDFEEIHEGEIVGMDGDREVRASRQSVILFAHDRHQVDAEAFLLGEKKKNDLV